MKGQAVKGLYPNKDFLYYLGRGPETLLTSYWLQLSFVTTCSKMDDWKSSILSFLLLQVKADQGEGACK